jgi:hypothetical protein
MSNIRQGPRPYMSTTSFEFQLNFQDRLPENKNKILGHVPRVLSRPTLRVTGLENNTHTQPEGEK